MKKIQSILILVLATALLVTACSSSSKRKIPAIFPDFVQKAIKNVPEDVLIGVGTANLASLSQSMTTSATRARAEISRQLNSMIRDMVRDYQASSEVDPQAALSFQENITVVLSQSSFAGSTIIAQDQDKDGNVWTVVQLSKSNAAQEITQAQAAARLQVPQMASFDAEARMNDAFQKLLQEEVQVAR